MSASTEDTGTPESVADVIDAGVLACLDPWLRDVLEQIIHDNAILRVNGATEATAARIALVGAIAAAAKQYFESEISTAEAAAAMGTCAETVRRKIRTGELPAQRNGADGRLRVRRGDAIKIEKHRRRSYDPAADAQDIAKKRRG